MYKKLNDSTLEELLARRLNGLTWVKTNAPQDDEKVFTVSGSIYDDEKYVAACKLLEDIEYELDSRFKGWDLPGYEERQNSINEEKISGFVSGFFTLNQLTKAEKLQVMRRYFDENTKYVERDEIDEEIEIIDDYVNEHYGG